MEEYIVSRLPERYTDDFASPNTGIGQFEIFRRKFNVKYERVRSEIKREVDKIINKVRDDEIMLIRRDFEELMKIK